MIFNLWMNHVLLPLCWLFYALQCLHSGEPYFLHHPLISSPFFVPLEIRMTLNCTHKCIEIREGSRAEVEKCKAIITIWRHSGMWFHNYFHHCWIMMMMCLQFDFQIDILWKQNLSVSRNSSKDYNFMEINGWKMYVLSK